MIESAAAKAIKAHVIKSHHNVGGLPETMKLKLVEPLRELYKADWYHKTSQALVVFLPYELLETVSNRIISELEGVSCDLRRQQQAARDDRVGVMWFRCAS